MGIALTIIGALVFIAGIVLFVQGLLKKSGKRIAGAIAIYVVGFVVLIAGIIMWIHAIDDDSVGMIPDIIKLGMSLNT